MPRVWAYVDPSVYAELERLAAERGVEVPKIVSEILTLYATGRLERSYEGDRKVEELEERVKKLEEQVLELRAALKLLLEARSK